MKYKTYIAIDDTDEIGYTKSTGMIAENIVEFINERFCECSFISRHQLLIDERVNYTSHNSSMCFSTYLNEAQRDEVIKFAQAFLIKESAPSSEPGLAVAFEKDILNLNSLIEFGKRAKVEFITKDEAYDEAKRQNVYLKELKNEGRGVIGALAGIALRLSGNDGRIKGKIRLQKDEMSAQEILNLGFIDEILDENFKQVNKDEIILTGFDLKLIVRNSRSVLLVKRDKNGKFKAYDIKDLRGF
ncbi:hypothetical protein [Campylobacter sp. CCUG 57310]|uniref:hypothetical protein n=1 Tax=Campylobacter sp. CCUG 57310 TaxID=2517362 RepID=UPI00156338D7|nr:hypothetical protein [Campylobacter sp. CCUG 57310]QKF93029.1 hypothetical protein CORI_1873 [Campylobacter sp. CCUG 57310]